jgi:hypothetical protein
MSKAEEMIALADEYDAGDPTKAPKLKVGDKVKLTQDITVNMKKGMTGTVTEFSNIIVGVKFDNYSPMKWDKGNEREGYRRFANGSGMHCSLAKI